MVKYDLFYYEGDRRCGPSCSFSNENKEETDVDEFIDTIDFRESQSGINVYFIYTNSKTFKLEVKLLDNCLTIEQGKNIIEQVHTKLFECGTFKVEFDTTSYIEKGEYQEAVKITNKEVNKIDSNEEYFNPRIIALVDRNCKIIHNLAF